uniref:Piwi domain-containing protein n=1 Tax=Panagrolaimus davidi TaxID=227884 RepID=A0A914QUK3_9BILA
MSLKKCISSQWIIKIDRNAFAFQYNVKIVFEYSGGQKRLFISENNKNYFKAFCRKAINGIDELKRLVYAYDGCGSLWTPKALKSDIEVEIPQPDLDDCLKQYLQTIIENPDGVLHVSLKKADVIMMTDFTNSLVKDRPWRTLMEFILSEDAVTRKGNPFVTHGSGCLMETTEHEFLYGLKYREGNYKGCHVINGNHGVPEMSLAMNYCRKVFFPANANFQKFITDFIGSGKTYDDAEILCWGLRLCTNDNPRRILQFENFIGHNISGGDIFAVMKNSKEKFSLKDLQIIPDQSIPNDAMPKDLKDVDLNKFKPHDRKRFVEEQFRKLRLNNEVTAAFGVTVEQNMLEGTFDDSISVNVHAMNNQMLVQDKYGAFKSDCRRYYKRGNFKKVILFATIDDSARISEDIKKVVKFASNKSDADAMVSFEEFDTTQKTLDPWVNALKKHKGSGNLVITVDETPDSHAFLKFAEAVTGVNTQHLKPSTISGVRSQTMQNIVHKLNIKMGGLNHVIRFSENVPNLDLNNGKIFVMGLDVCHPTGEKYKGETDEPSFVGLSANYMEHPQEFGNLFFAQTIRKELIDQRPLTYFTEKLLSHVQKFRAIKTIVLLRDGVSEGQYSKVLEEEIGAIKKAAKNLKLDVKVVAFIVTKNGNVRHFYHSNNGGIEWESMPHGSFINFGTRYGFQQFYMTAHRSLIGTAKTIMITKICDEIGISLHEAQEFLLGLTYLHQIVSSPISLPTPINQAEAIAQRGQTLYRILKTYCSSKIPKNHDGSIDNKKLTELLSINNESLPISRYNA